MTVAPSGAPSTSPPQSKPQAKPTKTGPETATAQPQEAKTAMPAGETSSTLSERHKAHLFEKAGREGGLKSGKIRKEKARREKVKSIVEEKLAEKASPTGDRPLSISSVVPTGEIARSIIRFVDRIGVRAIGAEAAMTAEERAEGERVATLLIDKYGEQAPWMIEYAAELSAGVWAAGYGLKLFDAVAKKREVLNAHIDSGGQGVGQEHVPTSGPAGQTAAVGLRPDG